VASPPAMPSSAAISVTLRSSATSS
jgi:hypothetical protein